MSRWIRGIYNAAANFNMSNALRSASGRIMGGNTEHVREECNKSNQCNESSQSSKSDCTASASTAAASSARTAATSCGTAASSASKNGVQRNTCYADNKHSDECTCSLCRDYRDYTASIRTEGQGAGSWIRLSDESGSFKRTNPDAADSIERCTGIPTGVTI